MVSAATTAADPGLLTILRSETLVLIIGILLGLAGLITSLLAFSRWQAGMTYLLYFGLCSFLYGIRLLAETRSIQLLTGIPGSALLDLDAIITYSIPVFFMLFILSIVGSGLWNSLKWLLYLQIGFTVAGITADLVSGRPLTLAIGNNLMVILYILVLLINLFHRTLRWRNELLPLRIGLTVFAFLVLTSNLVSIGLISLRRNYEPYGMFFLVSCLGYVAVTRFFSNRDQLVALHTELSTARRIQASILPKSIPEIPGLAIAARYRPMSAVAGDFYDFYAPDSHHLGVLVADVSGHGVPAALIASMVKVAFSAQKARADDPAALLAGMNREFAGQFEQEFVTAAYLYLDLRQNRAVFAGAGHPPLYRWQPGQAALESFPGKGLMLGPIPDATYVNTSLDLHPGDRFILYTDGIPEARNGNEDFYGDERFRQSLVHTMQEPPDRQADRCLESLRAWTGDRMDDDLTLVIVAGIEENS